MSSHLTKNTEADFDKSEEFFGTDEPSEAQVKAPPGNNINEMTQFSESDLKELVKTFHNFGYTSAMKKLNWSLSSLIFSTSMINKIRCIHENHVKNSI